MASKKIMIVDDDSVFLEELRQTLQLSGYEITILDAPDKFFETVSKMRPDVILIDLKMPGKTGFQLAAEMKYFAELAHIPVIAMSAYFKEEYTPFLTMCGIRTCLKKPFNPLDVITRIEDALHVR